MLKGDDFFTAKDRIIQDSLFSIGWFYLSPQLALENAGYNSNIYQYEAMENPDWMADIGLNLTLSAIIANRLILQVQEFPYLTWYAENTQHQAWNNRFTFSLLTYLGPFNLKYVYELPNLYSRPSSEFGQRLRYTVEQHTASVDYGSHLNFFVRLQVSQQEIHYQTSQYLDIYNPQQTMDRKILQAGISLNKVIFSQTVLSLQYEYGSHQFTNMAGRDGIEGSLSLAIDFPQHSRITGSARFGYRLYSPSNPQFKPFQKPFGTGRISFKLGNRIKLHFEYLVNNFFSYSNEETYFEENTFRPGIEFYLSKAIKIGYRYGDGRITHRSLVTEASLYSSHLISSAISVGFKIFANTGLGLEYRKYSYKSDFDHLSRQYEFIGGFIIYDF